MLNQPERLQSMGNSAETVIWAKLDEISKDLKEVVRISTKIESHGQILQRHTEKLDNLERKVHETAIWQAEFGDRDRAEQTISTLRGEIEKLKSTSTGNETLKKVLFHTGSWVFGICAAYIVFKFKSGS